MKKLSTVRKNGSKIFKEHQSLPVFDIRTASDTAKVLVGPDQPSRGQRRYDINRKLNLN